jgi:hypothetical protein
MKTVCCSIQCERQSECANHAINNEGVNYCEDFYNFGWGSISNEKYEEGWTCSALGNWAMFEPIEKKTDYEQWKDWLDKWNVKYEEKTWNPNEKELVVDGSYCVASVAFDLNNNFICMTAYE